MTQANQADLFGEGVYGAQGSGDPNSLPNPNNPGGISNNQLAILQARQAQSRANANAPGGRVSRSNQALSTARARGDLGRGGGNALGAVKPMNIPSSVLGDTAQIAGYAATLGPARDLLAEYGGPAAPIALLGEIGAAGAATDLVSPARRGAPTQVGGALGLEAPQVQRFAPMQPAGGASYASGAGGGSSGGSALSAEAQRVLNQANQFSQQNAAASAGYNAQAAAAGQRAAPQMAAPSAAQANAVYDRAMNFNAQSGSDRILAERADVSGAGRLENYQLDQQGIANLEGFQSTNSQQGVNALYGYNPTNSAGALPGLENFEAKNVRQGVANLENYRAQDTLNQANRLNNFYSHDAQMGADALQQFAPGYNQAAADLQNFQADRSGINRLNAYADEAEGPSAAQALLRAQSDADKRTMLSIARSGRGGPAAIAQAQRQALSEGSAIAGETRGQAAVIRAQETNMYKTRQLQALAQAGSLISQAEAQRLQALAASGQLTNEQDQMRLAAVQAYASVKTAMDSQRLSAQQAAGQLISNADTNALSALQSAGQLRAAQDQMRLSGMQTGAQLRSNMDSQLLSATQSAANLQGQMDAQRLSAIGQAAGLRTQGDVIRSNNLQAAGQMRLQGSEINQRGAIAASQADLAAQSLNLQSLSLAGNISTTIRAQDIDVLRTNLSAELQNLALSDQQVRFFSQMAQDRDLASQNMSMQANQLGINTQMAQQQLDLQWSQFGFQQLSSQQQLQYQYDVLNSGNQNAANALAQQNRNQLLGTGAGLLLGLGNLFQGGGGGVPRASNAAASSAPSAYAPQSLPPVPNMQLTMPTYQSPYQTQPPRVTL